MPGLVLGAGHGDLVSLFWRMAGKRTGADDSEVRLGGFKLQLHHLPLVTLSKSFDLSGPQLPRLSKGVGGIIITFIRVVIRS